MKLIVGLGNPGEKYATNRHNFGFMVVDALARKLLSEKETVWQKNNKFNSLVIKIDQGWLVKPQTMMNASGFAVSKMANYYRIGPEDILVVHDDLDFPLGKIKIRRGGGTAGHRGIASIMDEIGSGEFVRFRLGIGHPSGSGKSDKRRLWNEEEVQDYVLSNFEAGELAEAKQVIKKTVRAIVESLDKGVERAMNEFNS